MNANLLNHPGLGEVSRSETGFTAVHRSPAPADNLECFRRKLIRDTERYLSDPHSPAWGRPNAV